MNASRQGHPSAWRLMAVAGIIFLLPPTQAQAHTPIKGLGGFASGFLHPFFTPPHLLVLLALGVLLGQRQPLILKQPVTIFAVLAATGLTFAATEALAGVPSPFLIIIGLCTGSCVVAARPLPVWAWLTLCAAAALVLGLDSGVDPGTVGATKAQTLFATWVSLILCVVNIAFYVSLLPSVKWVQTGVRVAGSWIVAIALLMLAFALRR